MNETKRILVAEDDTDLQEIYQLVLTKHGYDVVTANNGIEALAVLKSYRPHLILLDVLMPLMDGREFLKNFDGSLYPDVRIVVTSNLSDQTLVDQVLQLGAHHHVLKSSLAPNALLELVETTLS